MMNLSTIDWALWVVCFLVEAALFTILIFRRRCREFPVFTSFIALTAAIDLALYLIYAHGSRHWYARVYYSDDLLGFVLRLGVIWEVVRIVMRPTGSWLRDARKQFILGGAAGVLLAAAFSWMLAPPAMNHVDLLIARSNLFTDLVVCELFVLMLLTAKQFGLGFRNHVFALVTGWSGWVSAAMLVDLLHGYFGTHFYYDALNDVRTFAYLAALVYWMVQFWRDEPPRQPLPAEFQAYLQALHERTKKDIDTLDAQR